MKADPKSEWTAMAPARTTLALALAALLTGAMPSARAGGNETYVTAHNRLVRMLTARCQALGLSTNTLILKSDASIRAGTASVSQGDLNVLRARALNLMQNHYILEPAFYNLASNATSVAFPRLIKDFGNKGRFTKVPSEFVEGGTNVYANSFSDAPVLWIHFEEIHQALLRMRSGVWTGHQSWTNRGEINVRLQVASGATWDLATTLADNKSPPTSQSALQTLAPTARASGIVWPGPVYGADVSRRYSYLIVKGLSTSTPHALHFYSWGDAPVNPGGAYSPRGIEHQIAFRQWKKWSSSDATHADTVFSSEFGRSAHPEWPPEPVDDAWRGQGYRIAACATLIEFPDLPCEHIANPAQDDSEKDGLVATGCECNDCLPGADPEWRNMAADPHVAFPLGITSGLTTGGLRVKAYVTQYQVDDVPRQMFSLDTQAAYTENAKEGWAFATVKRPSGAEVVFALKGSAAGCPVNVRRSYRASGSAQGCEIHFSGADQVVHAYSAGGQLTQVRQHIDGEEVVLSGLDTFLPGLAVERDTNRRVTMTRSSLIDAEVAYTGNLATSVTYRDKAGRRLRSLGSGEDQWTFTSHDADGVPDGGSRAVTVPGGAELWLGMTTGDGGQVAEKRVRLESFDAATRVLTVTETTILGPESPRPQRAVTVRRFKPFAWGDELISETIGADGTDPQTTFYHYGTNALDTDNYARLALVEYPDGSWTAYRHDARGRRRIVLRPFKDAPPSDDPSTCRATRYYYAGDPLLTSLHFPVLEAAGPADNRPRLVVEEVLGREVERVYHAFLPGGLITKRCATPGAAYDAADNLTDETRACTNGLFKGRPLSAQRSDGATSLYSYEYDALAERLSVTQANGEEGGGQITHGTRSVTVLDASGRLLSDRTEDAASGVVLSDMRFTLDAFGRVTCASNAVDGAVVTTAYGCCGPETVVDADGVTTVRTYDALRRLYASSRLGVTEFSRYDVHRNTVRTTLMAPGLPPAVTASSSDAAGRMVATTNALGAVTRYAYGRDPHGGGQVITTVFADGGVWIETFYRDGQLRSVTGTAAHPAWYDYGVDDDGLFTVEYRGAGPDASEWIKTCFDRLGRTVRTIYPDGYSIAYTYDSRGRPVRQSDGLVTTLTSYAGLNETRRDAVDMNGNDAIDLSGVDRITEVSTRHTRLGTRGVRETVTRIYATDGNDQPEVMAVHLTAVDGSERWQIAYGVTSRVTVARNRAARTRTECHVRPDGVRVIQVYTNGLLTVVTDESATGETIRRRTHTYDSMARLSAVTDTSPDGSLRTAAYGYDAAGSMTSVTVSVNGAIQSTAYEYDVMGRNVRTTRPDGRQVCRVYGLRGELRRQQGAGTYPVTYTHDEQGRLHTLSTYRDGPAGPPDITTWSHDARRGWMTAKAYADGSAVSYEHRPNGSLASRTWARGVRADYGYDPGGLLTNVVYSDGTPRVAYAHDRTGQALRIVDAAGTHTNVFAADGQLAAVTFAQAPGQRLEYSQDAVGRPAGFRLLGPEGAARHEAAYAYDSAGRLSTVSENERAAAYRYAADGSTIDGAMFSEGANHVLTMTRQHDGFGRLTRIASAPAPGDPVSFAYEHNAANLRTACTLGDGTRWRYEYDALDQLVSGRKHFPDGSAVGGAQFEYAYDTIGNRRTARNAAGVAALPRTYTANRLNQYTQASMPGQVLVTGEAEPGSTVTVRLNADTPARAANRQGRYFWQLLDVANGDSVVFASNIMITAYAAEVQDGQTSHLVRTEIRDTMLPRSPESFIHDADGNLLQDGLFAYTWNAENRLIRIESLPAVPENRRVRGDYLYDAQGRRVRKTVSTWIASNLQFRVSSSSTFLYDGWNPMAELVEAEGAVSTNYYLWGLDLSGTLQGAGGIGGLLAITRSGTGAPPVTLLPAFDGNGNIVTLLDAATALPSATYEYGPFGEPLRTTGPEAEGNPWRFSTRYTDTETSLVMYPYRPYSPVQGRFLSRDPIGEVGGLNLHAFVGNKPADFVDPWGLALYAFDGTWNDRERMERPTNVAKLVDVYEGLVHYEKGVGTDWYTKHIGGACGVGGENRIEAMYKKLVEFYNTPDATGNNQQIDVIGFSRGAALARTFVNYINSKGGVPLLGADKKPSGIVCPVKIRFLGIFDTVASFGLPGNNVNRGQQLGIPPNVRHVRHAVALDEKRGMFPLSSALSDPSNPNADPRIVEQGFRGAHSDIGGGYADGDRSNFALMWMHAEGVRVGVPFGPLGAEDVGARNPRLHDERGWWERWKDSPREIYYY